MEVTSERHHCLLETTSGGATHPELQLWFIFPPQLFYLWGKKKKKTNSEEKVVREHKGSMMKPLDSDALEPDDTSGTFYQNLLPDLDCLSKSI